VQVPYSPFEPILFRVLQAMLGIMWGGIAELTKGVSFADQHGLGVAAMAVGIVTAASLPPILQRAKAPGVPSSPATPRSQRRLAMLGFVGILLTESIAGPIVKLL